MESEHHVGADNNRISSAISGYPYFTGQFMAVVNLAPISKGPSAPVGVSTPDYLLEFARRTLRSCLDTCRSRVLGGRDGVALVDVALYFDDPSIFLSQTYVTPTPFIAVVHIRLIILQGCTYTQSRTSPGCSLACIPRPVASTKHQWCLACGKLYASLSDHGQLIHRLSGSHRGIRRG